MIVICTHKNIQTLERLLKSIKEFSVENHKICVVETSENIDAKNLVEKQFNAIFLNSTERLWEVGAYISGMQAFPNEKEYFLFQDSLEIVSFGWERMFRVPSGNTKLVALKKIELWNDPGQHKHLLELGIGNGYYKFQELFEKWDENGFGCMYTVNYMPQRAVKKFFKYGIEKLFCYNKCDAIESERIWGLVAYKTCGFASTEEFTKDFLGYKKYIIKHYIGRK